MTIPVFTLQRMLQTVTTAAAGLLITSVTMVRYLLGIIHILRAVVSGDGRILFMKNDLVYK